jgi:hypothetical protein
MATIDASMPAAAPRSGTGPNVRHGGLRAQLEALAEGQIDVLVAPILVRHRAVAEAADRVELVALALPEDAVAALEARFGMRPTVMAEGAYGFLDRPVQTAQSELVLAVRADRDADSVAEVTQALYTHLDRLRAVHPLLSSLARREMADVPVVPLHPGARAYLREAGLLAAE